MNAMRKRKHTQIENQGTQASTVWNSRSRQQTVVQFARTRESIRS